MSTKTPDQSNPSKQKKSDKVKRGHGLEARRVNQRLKGFDLDQSKEWGILKKKFSSGITHNELKSIAQIVCLKSNIKLDREASRDNRVLIKWFVENWHTIEPYIQHISLHDDNKEIIDDERVENIIL